MSGGDFGEPWTESGGVVVNRHGETVFVSFAKELPRAALCTSALAGISDPERFVREAKAALVMTRGASIWQHPEEIARLAAEWTEGTS